MEILLCAKEQLKDYIQDFKLGGVHLRKLRGAERGAKTFGVFRVKNHDFTQKNPRSAPDVSPSIILPQYWWNEKMNINIGKYPQG